MLSRRRFLAAAGAAGLATPLLVKSAAAWAEPIDFRPGVEIRGELFVWPRRLVISGPGAVVDGCAFVGPYRYAAYCAAGATSPDDLDAALLVLSAEGTTISHNAFFGGAVAPEKLERAKRWIAGERPPSGWPMYAPPRPVSPSWPPVPLGAGPMMARS